jgi:acyl-CoA thioesterase I
MPQKILLIALIGSVLACGSGDRGLPGRDDGETDGSTPPTPAASATDHRPVVLFLGTSLTAGLGVDRSEAYPAVIQQLLDSAGIGLQVVNAGVSGETSAGGLRRIDALLSQPVRILVLELGANDGLRGLDLDTLRANLQGIIDRTRAAHPDARIVIAGMQAPPNLGDRYTSEFRQVFEDVARENNAALVPFLLEGVGGHPELNQADGIHPTPEGHRLVAANVWAVLKGVAEDVAGEPAKQ